MRIIAVLAACLAASPVLAQSFSGPTRAVDGDTLVMGGERPLADMRPSKPRQFAANTGGWSFRHCGEARAAGAAPLYRGQPGYGAHMDGDGDGIACEPRRS